MKKTLLTFFLSILFSTALFAQQTVVGNVKDVNGQPIPGVNILVENTNLGGATDFDGNFTLSDIPDGSTLIVSYVGFVTQKIKVNTSDMIQIILIEDLNQLDEVVLTGYGSARKKDLTGAVDKISTETFNKGAIVTPEQLIAAKTPGVQITSGSGAAGSSFNIRIRGGSSLSASNNPLIVVDGVPLDVNNAGLNAINPNDIEDFTVLKDASATAIYGSRGSNGVLMITTKKGTKNTGLSTTFSTRLTVSDPVNRLELLKPAQLESILVDGYSLGETYTDWQDEIYRTSFSVINDLAFSGGTEKSDYRVSINQVTQEGVLKTDKFNKNTLSFVYGTKLLNDKLDLRINSKNSQLINNYANQGAIGSAVDFDPTRPVKDGSIYGGYFEWLDQNGLPNTLAPKNPVGLLYNRSNKATTNRYIGNVNLAYSITDDLKFTVNTGFDYSEQVGLSRIGGLAASNYRSEDSNGFIGKYSSINKSRFLDSYLNYTKTFDSIDSRLDATVGYTFQQFYRHGRYVNNDLQGNESQYATDNGLSSENWIESYFARAFYSYKDRYSLTFTTRMDTSSRFGPDNQTGIFPSAAAAWTLSEEEFMKGQELFSNLKFRAGWGITGQQEINDFEYLGLYTLGDQKVMYQLGDTFYYTLRPEGYNSDIKWEETTTLNLGVDFGILDDKITASVDVYDKYTKDLLNFVTPAAGSNLENGITTNIGEMRSKGIETSVNFKAIDTDEITWNIDANFTYQNREITKLTLNEDPSFKGVLTGGISGGVGNTVQIHANNQWPNSFFLYQQVYDTNGKALEGVYVDQNDDGVINEDDKVINHQADPDYYFGLTSTMQYGKFDFSATFRGSIGNYVYNNVYSTAFLQDVFANGFVRNASSNLLVTNFENAQYWSDYYLQDASYLKMDNLTIGYQVSEKTHLYLTAQNMLTITNYKGIDPEVPGGIDSNVYPRPMNVLVGLNIQL
jgi:iron complex outermembrane receptor protein